ncbi:hypothetical protein V6N11_080131 [Hibiscus sabdariffa]|uniref:MHD domain-containing protein n=2 Tax=Hibiscus sabdariffa TaxID=183260 RepID=A0ABR1ZLT0_9ROSI
MPVAASAIYFLNLRGDVLINRLYRDDVGGNMVDAFRLHILQTKELGTCPVRQIGRCSFFYMRISNVYVVIVVSSNANVACAFKFVVEAVAMFKSYFGGAFDEDAIRNNFVLIYELLDEIMDFGHPQNLSPEILKLYITQEGVRSPFSHKADKPIPNATLQVTGAVGWRREGLVYKKNEVFLDIVESVNLLMSSKGSVLRCDVTGKILMKCFLSGMPDLKLGLNDKIGLEKESQIKSRPTKSSSKTIELDDVTFHQCVNLTRFNSEKTVSFVPPDGEFELMKYRITEGVNLPFRVLPTIKELGRTRMEVNVKVKSVFGAKMFALGVVVKIPVPKQTAKTSSRVTSGRAKYSAAIDCLVWKIRKFPGQTEPTLSAEVELISTTAEKKPSTKPPIQMEFQVPMFTASGLRVRFLKVSNILTYSKCVCELSVLKSHIVLKVWEKSGYSTVEWVRYITKAGSYEGCLVLPASLLRWRSMASRLGYQPLTEDGYGELDRQVMVVVGREKREFLVDAFVLEESPFRVLIDATKKDDGKGEERGRVMLVDVDAILFEHMLWLMNNDSSSLFQLNVEEIIDFYSQDN